MKPMPHVHTYVRDRHGNPISKCIDSDRHPSLLARALQAVQGLFLFRGKPTAGTFRVEGGNQ